MGKIKLLTRNLVKYIFPIILLLLIFFLSIYLSYNFILLDSDSGREFRRAKIFLEEGKIDTGPAITQVLYAVFLVWNSYKYMSLRVIQSIFSVLLVLIIFQFIKKETNYIIASISLLFFFFSNVFFEISQLAVPYIMSLFFVTLSTYFLNEYTKNSSIKKIIISAFSMALAVYSKNHALGAIGIPFLYFTLNKFMKKKVKFSHIAKFYSFFLLFIIPWLVWTISVSGILFYHYPNTWLVLEYGEIINTVFWKQPSPYTLDYYVKFIEFIPKSVFLIPAILFSFIGLFKYKNNALILSWLFFSTILIIIGKVPTYPKYAYSSLPILVILAGMGLFVVYQKTNLKMLIIFFSLICVLGIINIGKILSEFQGDQQYLSPWYQDLNNIQKQIKSMENIYFRSYSIQPFLPQNKILMLSDVDKSEAITFLNWTTEKDVASIMEKYNILWVLLYRDKKMEKLFHGAWFKSVTGYYPQHYIKINESPYFKRVWEGQMSILYQIDKSGKG